MIRPDGIRRRRRAGFSLVEVLIATTVAAGVVVAIIAGLRHAVMLQQRGAAMHAETDAAATLAARIRAGLGDAEVLEGFPGWTIARSPYAHGAPLPGGGPAFERVRLSTEAPQSFSLELIAPRRDAS